MKKGLQSIATPGIFYWRSQTNGIESETKDNFHVFVKIWLSPNRMLVGWWSGYQQRRLPNEKIFWKVKTCPFLKTLSEKILTVNFSHQPKWSRINFSDCSLCRVLSRSSNVIAMPNWPHFQSSPPVSRTEDSENVQMANEPHYRSLFPKQFLRHTPTYKEQFKVHNTINEDFGSFLA